MDIVSDLPFTLKLQLQLVSEESATSHNTILSGTTQQSEKYPHTKHRTPYCFYTMQSNL